MRYRIFYPFAIVVLGALAYFGFQADHKSFVGSLFAAFLSAFMVFFIEMEIRPQIRIVKEETPSIQPNGRKFLRVIVENRELWWPLKLIMDRRPVYQARAWITFLTESNNPVFARQMIGRWSETPEPVRPISISLSSSGPAGISFLRDLSVSRDAVDIASGDKELLDIVMRVPGEKGCRGWHNRMIENPNIPPEDQFELSKGRYHALVRMKASGRSFKYLFRIVCDVGIEDFRLEPIRRVPRGL
jgi:hypothetical protein